MGMDKETILKIKHVLKSEVHKGKETSPLTPPNRKHVGSCNSTKVPNLWDKSASSKHGPN